MTDTERRSVTKIVIQIVTETIPTSVSVDGYRYYIYRVEAAAVAAVAGRKGQRRWTRSARPCH